MSCVSGVWWRSANRCAKITDRMCVSVHLARVVVFKWNPFENKSRFNNDTWSSLENDVKQTLRRKSIRVSRLAAFPSFFFGLLYIYKKKNYQFNSRSICLTIGREIRETSLSPPTAHTSRHKKK